MSLLYAAIGAKALYLLYAWLASAIIASYLSNPRLYTVAHIIDAYNAGSGDLTSVLRTIQQSSI